MEQGERTILKLEKSKKRVLIENTLSILVAIGLAVVVQHFLVRPFVVNGSSMDPTLKTKDYLLIDRLSYRFHEPSRGDVVVFKSPPEPKKYFIKRIIGLPGDTVVIEKGLVTIKDKAHPKGVLLDESFIVHKSGDTITVTVPEGHYFVMGDNRIASFDSRSWGTLPEENISGKALVRLLPIKHIDLLPGKVHYTI